MSHPEAPRDRHGGETLDAMAAAPRYNAWQIDVLRPWIGRRILEIGSGIGNITRELRALDPELLVATDLDPAYRQRLMTQYSADPVVRVESVELPLPNIAARFAAERFDTAIALNVVEHIEDHVGAVRSMAEAVQPGGHVVILVPALQAIYGAMDTALGHFRRYDKRQLRSVLDAAGLEVVHLSWFNRVGVLGWWWRGRVRGLADIPASSAATFDRLVPLLRQERWLPLPFGQSVIGIGRRKVG
jgi:SAM-dependent methyltransferase